MFKAEVESIDLYLISFGLIRTKKSIYTYNGDEGIEGGIRGEGFKDSDEINLIFQLAAVEFLARTIIPDVIFLHDGHTGFIPGIINSRRLYRKALSCSKLLFILHNGGDVYHQKISYRKISKYRIISHRFLKKSKNGSFSDPIFLASLLSKPITVSSFYADELNRNKHRVNDGGYGDFLNKMGIKISGITNGIYIPQEKYVQLDKDRVYSGLNKYIGSLDKVGERSLFLFQNRITEQKGIDLLLEGIFSVLSRSKNINFIIMGEGEERYKVNIQELVKKYSGNIIYLDWYNKEIANKLFNISDFFIVSSLWEPCGLTDFEAILQRSIPVVRSTGGLKKIQNGITGYNFNNSDELAALCLELSDKLDKSRRSMEDFKDRALDVLKEKYSWESVVKKDYLPLIRSLYDR